MGPTSSSWLLTHPANSSLYNSSSLWTHRCWPSHCRKRLTNRAEYSNSSPHNSHNSLLPSNSLSHSLRNNSHSNSLLKNCRSLFHDNSHLNRHHLNNSFSLSLPHSFSTNSSNRDNNKDSVNSSNNPSNSNSHNSNNLSNPFRGSPPLLICALSKETSRFL